MHTYKHTQSRKPPGRARMPISQNMYPRWKSVFQLLFTASAKGTPRKSPEHNHTNVCTQTHTACRKVITWCRWVMKQRERQRPNTNGMLWGVGKTGRQQWNAYTHCSRDPTTCTHGVNIVPLPAGHTHTYTQTGESMQWKVGTYFQPGRNGSNMLGSGAPLSWV